MFSQYCADKYSVEPVEIVYADGRHYVTPNLKSTQMKVTAEAVNRLVGINIQPKEVSYFVIHIHSYYIIL